MSTESSTTGRYDMNLPWIESPFFASILATKRLTPEHEALARQFHRDGYIVIQSFVADDLASRIIAETSPLYTSNPDGPRSTNRVQHAWHESQAVRALASDGRILDLLELLYGRPAFPFQTLNFRYGSQQAGHSDQIHFSSLPPRYMCGVWAALEDVDDDNGPLFYYPGSHRLPEYDLYDIGLSAEHADYRAYERFVAALMTELGFERKQLHAKRGSVLIWSSNIVHGGMPIAHPGRTRHSQVTHYYFSDCIYYTPVYSNRTLGEYLLNADAVDIRTGRPLPPSYNGAVRRDPVGERAHQNRSRRRTRGPSRTRAGAHDRLAPVPRCEGVRCGRAGVSSASRKITRAWVAARRRRRSKPFRLGARTVSGWWGGATSH